MVDPAGPSTPGAASTPARPAKAAATIYDIAQLAGVNPSTVSRALSKPGRVSPKTETLIRQAASDLNYRPNPIARALPTGRTGTFAIIVADITNPMYFEVVRGAERAAAASGYTLILAESQESATRESETVERIVGAADGIILLSTRLEDGQIRQLRIGKPLIVMNRRVSGVESVVPSVRPGITQALDHLSELGHRQLAFLSGPAASWMHAARWKELRAGAAQRGMSLVAAGTRTPTLEGGSESLAAVLDSGATAVIAYNDLMAIGLLRAATSRGLDVPAELSIIGFDDIFGSDFTTPPLTTIGAPLGLAGEVAVHRLLATMAADAEASPSAAPSRLQTRLIVRGSTARARRRRQ